MSRISKVYYYYEVYIKDPGIEFHWESMKDIWIGMIYFLNVNRKSFEGIWYTATMIVPFSQSDRETWCLHWYDHIQKVTKNAIRKGIRNTYLSRLYLYRGHHNTAWTLLFFASAWIPTSLFSSLMNKTRNLFLFCSYCISRSISALLACGNNQSHFRSVNNFDYSSVELIIIKKLD